jgi:hypothetical protein
VSNTLSVHSLLDGIAESSAALAPIKSGVALAVEPHDVIDHGSDTLREFPHRFKGLIVQPLCQCQAGHAASYFGDRHAIEDMKI